MDDSSFDQELDTVEAMEKWGGSFVRALARCWTAADPGNKAKLVSAFGKYFTEYRVKFVEKKEQKKGGK